MTQDPTPTELRGPVVEDGYGGVLRNAVGISCFLVGLALVAFAVDSMARVAA